MDKKVFRDTYGFDSGNIKWVPKGGELLEYIGQRVIRIHFTKDENGEFKSSEQQALIKSIWGYDPMKMTYKISYLLPDDPNEEGKNIVHVEEIIPEGFSTDIITEGENMNRFIPGHIHLKVVATDLLYGRLKQLYDERDTISSEELYKIDRDKDQNKLLKYCKNFQAVWNVDGEICAFRICQLKIRRNDTNTKRLTVYDQEGNKVSLIINESDKEYTHPELGTMKIIELIGEEELPEKD